MADPDRRIVPGMFMKIIAFHEWSLVIVIEELPSRSAPTSPEKKKCCGLVVVIIIVVVMTVL